MDVTALLDAIEKALLFDLWRLKAAIGRALEDPRKDDAVREGLRAGQAVRYFDDRENREISGRVVEIKRSRALIQHDHDGNLWNIPFYMINLEGTDVESRVSSPARKVGRDSLRVGHSVGFQDRRRRDVYGVVVKLNPKTAIVGLPDGHRWTVLYCLLSRVLDAQDAAVAGHAALERMPESAAFSQAPEASERGRPE